MNAPYIPGLPGSQQPQVEPTTPDEDRESQERQDGAEKPTFGNEQAAMEAVNEMKEVQAKPAPWANCLSPESKELSIHDIQKIEAEKVNFEITRIKSINQFCKKKENKLLPFS